MSNKWMTVKVAEDDALARGLVNSVVARKVFKSEQQEIDRRTGLPKWNVLINVAGQEYAVKVQIVAAEAPALVPHTQVRFTGLVAGGGEHGLWFRADAVEAI